MATAETSEDSTTGSEPLGLFARIIIFADVFYMSNSSKLIHKILLQTDVALAVIFALSFGEVALLKPILYPLIAVHILFYPVPIFLSVYTGTKPCLHPSPFGLHLFSGTKRLRNGPRWHQKKWAKMGIFVLALPYIVGGMQSRLSGTAPETSEMIELLSAVVPVIQSYGVSFMTLLSLVIVAVHLSGVLFSSELKIHYREAVSESSGFGE